MSIDNPVLGQVAKPEMKRHIRRLEVLREALVGLNQDILNDIGSIDAPGNRRIEPHVDDTPQGFAKLTQEFIDSSWVAASGIAKEAVASINAAWSLDSK